MSKDKYFLNVFINCPFDNDYTQLRIALMFAIYDCGFNPTCALQENNGSDIRIDKIKKLIEEAKYSIHDISRTELDLENNLPRFNMPLELGVVLGAKFFGNKKHQEKNCLIIDKEQYRFQKFISDIAGQDIRSHNGDIKNLIKEIRNWLNDAVKGERRIPGGDEIFKRYRKFRSQLPKACKDGKIKIAEMSYNDYANMIFEWCKLNPQFTK